MSSRMRRVDESVREVLSEAVLGLKDPRIGFVTITRVQTTSDLRQAKVWVSVLGNEAKRDKSLDGLEAARGVLQTTIARQLRMKRTPTLTFEFDTTVSEGVRMSKLIDDLDPDHR